MRKKTTANSKEKQQSQTEKTKTLAKPPMKMKKEKRSTQRSIKNERDFVAKVRGYYEQLYAKDLKISVKWTYL